MSYEGRCHGGAVTSPADAETPARPLSCNGSIWRRKRLRFSVVPRPAVTIHGEDASRADRAVPEIRHHGGASP